MTYSSFIEWKNTKNDFVMNQKSWWIKLLYRYGVKKNHKALPYVAFTKSQRDFAEYLFTILEQPESKLSQHLMNIGDLRPVFEQVSFYCKSQRTIKP